MSPPRWADQVVVDRLERQAAAGQPDAARALLQLARHRRAPARSRQKRAARRAFIRLADRALAKAGR